jgi:uncharacterized membrane protein
MAQVDIITPLEPTAPLPVVRTLRIADLKDALAKGVEDFLAMPTHALFLALIYPVAGLVLARAMLGYDLIPLLYPLAAGFALIGPFASIGLYELSRRREAGLDTSWRHAFDVLYSPSIRGILALGLLLLALFAAWIFVADALYERFLGGREALSPMAFLNEVLTTRAGLALIWLGNGIGFLFALVAAAISVISFPLLLDRNVGFAAAVLTSVRVVLHNPLVMALWGLIVALSLALGSLPFLFGLAVVLPVLGHATWHLYRKAVEPDLGQRPAFRPRPPSIRYGADFPAAIFAPSRRGEEWGVEAPAGASELGFGAPASQVSEKQPEQRQ